MKAKALVAFYHDGLSVAAGQVLEVDASTLRRYGPKILEIVAAEKQAATPRDKQAVPEADR